MVIPIGERPEDGWRKWRCARCNRESSWIPHVGKQLRYQCNGIPRASELGNWVELLLEVFFIRKHGWQRLKAWLGMPQRCKCQQRQDALNQLGHLTTSSLSWSYSASRLLAGR